jgi:hypothetical protein
MMGILFARKTRALVLFAAALFIFGLSGCGPRYKLGKVTGKVTLAGQPLPDALVMFSPVQGGSPSAGRTDASGEYTLVYTRDVNGAEPGEHTVTISTYQEANPEGEPPTPEKPEKVPLKYREGPDLPKVTVQRGSNTFDFTLEPGPIEAPKAKTKGKTKPGTPVPCY